MTRLTKIGLGIMFLGAILKLISTLAMPSVMSRDISVPSSPLLVPLAILTFLSYPLFPLGIILAVIGYVGKK